MDIKPIEIIPQRIIPFDIGFSISNNHLEQIKKFVNEKNWKYEENNYIFGEYANLKIDLPIQSLFLYIYDDGIGVFSYEDQHIFFDDINSLDATLLLNDRRSMHKSILNHSATFSNLLDDVIRFLRCLKSNKRRITSYETWENRGLSYVMSFYYVHVSPTVTQNPSMISWMENMLYTDRHTYFSNNDEMVKKEYEQKMFENIDVLDSVYVCDSWANLLIIGELTFQQRQYYTNLEITLQHIWMYTYITEQILDSFLKASNKKITSSQLSEFYKILNDMSLIVNKYDSVISSTIHEREYKLFRHLQESSKLNVMFKTIGHKGNILEKKLMWEIEQKRLRSDRNIEIFIIIMTILQVLSGFGLELNDLFALKIFPFFVFVILLIILYRNYD